MDTRDKDPIMTDAERLHGKTVPKTHKSIPEVDEPVMRDHDVDNVNDNPDAITGEPGSHPVGTGIGAGTAGAAGAAIGTLLGGPVGGAVGAAIGAVAGGYAGKGVAEAIDPTAEEAYWRSEYSKRPYVAIGAPYDVYAPAYRYGWESHGRHKARQFDEVEADLRRDWERHRGDSELDWDNARPATEDAYCRAEEIRTKGRM